MHIKGVRALRESRLFFEIIEVFILSRLYCDINKLICNSIYD